MPESAAFEADAHARKPWRVRAAVGLAGRGHAEARRGAGHVAAVPVAVQRVRVWMRDAARWIRGGRVVEVAGKVDAALHLGRARPEPAWIGRQCLGEVRGGVRLGLARAAEVRVRVIDAGIDDGDPDVLAAQAGRARPRRRSADERHADRVVQLVVRDRLDGHHVEQRGERADLLDGSVHLDAVDRILVLAQHHRTMRLDGAADGVLPPSQVGLDRRAGLGRQRPGRARLDHRDRVTRHLQHHRQATLRQVDRRRELKQAGARQGRRNAPQ